MTLKPVRSPFSGSLATGHWYNEDGSVSEIYRERLLADGASEEEIERMNEVGRREARFRRRWEEAMAAHEEKYGKPKCKSTLYDRAIARSIEPPWELLSEGLIDLDEL